MGLGAILALASCADSPANADTGYEAFLAGDYTTVLLSFNTVRAGISQEDQAYKQAALDRLLALAHVNAEQCKTDFLVLLERDLALEARDFSLVATELFAAREAGQAVDIKGTATNIIHEGRLYRFCCGHCAESFQDEPDPKIIASVDAAIVKAQSADYPLKTCPISGKAFAKDAEPTNVFYGTRLVRLCCGRCAKSFAKDPSATIAALDAAYIAAQLPTYKGKTCPVSGEALGSMGKPINMLYGNTLVQLCCKGCVKSYKKNPAKLMAKKAKPGKHK